MTLQGKRVLITGGGSGTGADMARGFHAAGAQVVIAGRRADALAAVAGGLPGVQTVVADVTDEASVTAMFVRAGPCQIVIANAGAADSAPFARMDMDHWNAMIAVNLTGTFLTLRDGLRQIDGWGRLISIASIAGLKGAGYIAAYSAAKHGVIGLTRSVAQEVAKRPITVNALCPGYIDTEMTERTIRGIMEKTGRSREMALASITTTNPQGRLIAPAEVTAAALRLCGPGSDGINGQAIAINGGEA